MGGVSADQALRSYKWSYIRLAALHLRWQNLWSYWAIAVVLTLLGRTILLLKPAENIAIFPFYAPRVVQTEKQRYTLPHGGCLGC